MKKLTTVTLLGLGYLALGLSLSAMPVSLDFNSSQNQDTTSVSGEVWQEEFMKEAATLSDSLGATSVKSMVLKFGIGNDASKKRVSSKSLAVRPLTTLSFMSEQTVFETLLAMKLIARVYLTDGKA